MSEKRRPGPVLIELGDTAQGSAAPGPDSQRGEGDRNASARRGAREKDRTGDQPHANPADAPPIEDAPVAMPRPRTMELVTRLAGRGPSPLTRFFVNTGAALLTFLLSVAALNYIAALLDRWPVLGWIGVGLFALFTVAVLAMAWREYRAWGRFAQIDQIHREAGLALSKSDLTGAREVVRQLDRIYAGRREAEWGRANLAERGPDALDAQTLLTLAETQLLAPLDQEARREIEAATRTVATATALIPLTFADVAAALLANLRMIRRMAEIYGGRAGAVGGWRLARTVMTHLIATGAVAAGDDLIHTVAGGGLLAKLSRRFGEGVVNGALTARVGIAAMEVCRPLPFIAQPRPRVGNLVSRGLAGLFGAGKDDPVAAIARDSDAKG
ncbi:putative membrane protein [Paracoccus isoporae]|uniref:Putative membrane protein n=1 Tax=Paracoccus isoporae TaxID=591205 RepID=A0A1G6XWN5_9RHOB|nr:TIGR01620 family protein [Paracoccus isoporae]SDD82654.1 putative membrane protein [Paracoccus isoporae]